MEYFDLFSSPSPVEQDKAGPFAKLFLDAPQSSEDGGKSAQGLFSRLGNAAQSYLKWNMMGSPGATPGEMLKGMADWASLPMREPIHVPADSHTDDSGRILVKRDGQLVPWQDADPAASRAYEEDMRARSQWGPQAALSMMGGTPFATRGVVGAAGGRALQTVAEPAADAAQPGIRAYHGSPHDFNAFDLSKIGTGEGAQAYGHGLYFAENPEVARSYKPGASEAADTASSLLEKAGGNKEAAKRLHIEGFKSWGLPPDQGVLAAIDKPPGHMYEVNIKANPEHFLDWDKPLSEQSQHVRDAARTLGIPTEYNYPRLSPKIGGGFIDEMRPMTGADAYLRAGQYAGVGPKIDKVENSDLLRQAGIPGIKYLDQGSRASVAGTSNYVAFDPKLIDILKKYGLTGLIAGPAASGVGAQLDGILQKANERANGSF